MHVSRVLATAKTVEERVDGMCSVVRCLARGHGAADMSMFTIQWTHAHSEYVFDTDVK